MGRSIKVLNAVWKMHPMVLAHFIDRYMRLRKTWVSEDANGNCYHVWNSIDQVEDSAAALWAEVKPGRAALIADAHILCALAVNRHGVFRESGLSRKHATGTLLACQAMTN